MTEPHPELKVDPTVTLEGVLGFELLELGEERATGRFEVADRVRQPFGIVHGGAYAAFAESLASVATARAVYANGDLAMGQSNNTTFLRPVSEGTVNGEARRRHRGRTTWVWEIDFTDDAGRLCAVSQVTIAVRPRPS
jgi:1,4-dihydroxy-2-naphthoyl-CoA hydrolase